MRRALILIVLAAGCGESNPNRNRVTMPIDKVPAAALEAAMKTAKEKFPDLKFESASQKPDGVYKLTGKTKTGKVHDIEVTADGKITEIE
jgi:hypothetical protein